MEITNEVLKGLEERLNGMVPEWLNEAEIFLSYARLKGAVEVTVYFNFQRTNWVKINANKTSDGRIDVHCNMRSDWEFSETVLTDDMDAVADHVGHQIFTQVYADLADLFLSPTDGDSRDPLLHYGDRARFLPRDEVRKMIMTGVPYFAQRIDKGSSFREEDWYKEWESSQESSKNNS